MPRALTLACGRVSLPAHADRSGGGDRHRAGASVRLGGPAVTDLFMAGNRVVVAAPMGGSAHMAGRRITVGTVGGYARIIGADVALQGVIAAMRC